MYVILSVGNLTEGKSSVQQNLYICFYFISVFNNLIPAFIKSVAYLYLSYTSLQGRKSHKNMPDKSN